MRIIDKDVTGKPMSKLASEFHALLNPRDKNTKEFEAGSPAALLESLLAQQKKVKGGYIGVLDHMCAKLDILFTGDPQALMNLHSELEKKTVGTESLTSAAYKGLLTPFVACYKGFRKGTGGVLAKWFAALNVAVCPYCNRQWVTRLIGTNKHLYDIDHYFPKSVYPHFALSFYNLIPCCTICNQRMKHKRELVFGKHAHPYVDDMDAHVRFEIEEKTVDQFYKKDAEVAIEIKPVPGASHVGVGRADSNIDFFQLKKQYATHKDYGRELMQRGIIYSESVIDDIWLNNGKVFQTREDVVRMVMGNYVLSADIHKRPLAKLTKDLTEQFGLHKKNSKP
jgi:hypothetical protein